VRGKSFSIGVRAIFATLTLTLLAATAAVGGDTVLHQFLTQDDGSHAAAGLIWDTDGNLYGATVMGGGPCGDGAVFELSPQQGGGWTEKVLYSFNYCDGTYTDGSWPTGDLVMDAAGNLYGITNNGGTNTCYQSGQGCGTVFELSPNGDGSWTETVLHNFGTGADGAWPAGGLVFDAAGNLYGTTSTGGLHTCAPTGSGCGTVFELSPNGDGSWSETVLYNFSGRYGNGPLAALIFDADGNLYGTTSGGGTFTSCNGGYGCGTAFELSPAGGGSWTYRKLRNFGSPNDGSYPSGTLLLDAGGNLYGTTQHGGTQGAGIVFRLTPNGDGSWTYGKLHNFYSAVDGNLPKGGLVLDPTGNLYGTTMYGGTQNSGTVFKLAPNGGSAWTCRTLHNFWGGADGLYPTDRLLWDADGNLYGTTSGGFSSDNGGTVFEITP
jgi:uncharacterized repeat protein (TIGR03803 family)